MTTYTADGEEQARKLRVLGGADAEKASGAVERSTCGTLVFVVGIGSEEEESCACKCQSVREMD